jgi:hypothetical protein
MLRFIPLSCVLGALGLFFPTSTHAATKVSEARNTATENQSKADYAATISLPFLEDAPAWWQAFGHAGEVSGLRQALQNHYARLRENAAPDSPLTARLLVSEGLAIVRPTADAAADPNTLAELRGWQREASLKRRGGWSTGLLRHPPNGID